MGSDVGISYNTLALFWLSKKVKAKVKEVS